MNICIFITNYHIKISSVVPAGVPFTIHRAAAS